MHNTSTGGRDNLGLEDGGSITTTTGTQKPLPSAASGNTPHPPQEGSWWGKRHTLCVLSFGGLAVAAMNRTGLAIAIVAMVGSAANLTQDLPHTCPIPNATQGDMPTEGEFGWNEQTQGLILGSFFYGYAVFNFLGGRTTEYLGGRLTFGVGVVVPSALALLSPLCASTSTQLFIALQVLQGITQAAIYPAVFALFSAWVPPREKAKLLSFVMSGGQFGTLLSWALGGWLSDQQWLGGWPAIFYIFGAIGVVWGLPWYLLAHNLPETHPTISSAELHYVKTNRTYVHRDKPLPIPWKQIATSQPFWTLAATNVAAGYSSFMVLTELPTYMNNVLHLNMETNGLLSSLPYLVQCVTSISWGFTMDLLTKHNILAVPAVRNISTAISMYVSAAAFMMMTVVGCNVGWTVVVLCLAVGALGCLRSGSALGEQDIAPNFAGTLKGITNTIYSSSGFVAPAITGLIINDNQTLTAWSIAFVIPAVTNVLCGTIYLLCGTSEVQQWNEPILT